MNYVDYFENVEDFPKKSKKIATFTKRNEILNKVIGYARKGWNNYKMSDTRLQNFYDIINDSTMEPTGLMWNNHINIPSILREEMLESIHSFHMGVVNLKSLAWSYFWWNGLDRKIKEISKKIQKLFVQ